MKNRTIIGIVCMVLAAAVCFGIAPLVNTASAGKIEVVCVAADIPQGRILTDADVKVITVGGYNLSEKVVRDKTQAVGKYAACDLKADEMLMQTKLTSKADGAEDVFKSLDGSRQAMSITIVNFAAGMSGKLKNGDIVSVITTTKNQAVIPSELKYVRVITATSSDGMDAGQENEDGKTELPCTVTLLVNETQAKLLARQETAGKLHLSLVYRGEEATASKFLEAQDKPFQKGGE